MNFWESQLLSLVASMALVILVGSGSDEVEENF